jgi:ferredoxin/flavodoxin---NADP+ reductase
MYNASIVERIEVTPELLILRVLPDDGVKDFLSGQYVAIGLLGNAPRPGHYPVEETPPQQDKIIKRAYSIGSSPGTKEYLEFYVAVIPTGLLSSRLAVLEVGSRIYVAPKITGTFTLADITRTEHIVLVATGTGLAPYISMIKDSKIWEITDKISLLHGVRYSNDLAYKQFLTELQVTKKNFSYHPIVSRDEATETTRKGYVQDLIKDNSVACDKDNTHVYLCGNPAMVTELESLLLEKGFTEHNKRSPGNLHLEKYW